MRRYAWIVLLLVLMLCGCKGNNLIGKWNVSGAMGGGDSATVFEFTSSDVFIYSDLPIAGYKQKVIGTYTLKGNILNVTFKDIAVEGSGPDLDKVKQTLDLMKDQVLKDFNNVPKATLTWKNKDTFTLTPEGKTESTSFSRA